MGYHLGVYTLSTQLSFILSPETLHGSARWQGGFPTLLELFPCPPRQWEPSPPCLCSRVYLCLGACHPRVPSPFSGCPTSPRRDNGHHCYCQSHWPCGRVALISTFNTSLSTRRVSSQWERQGAYTVEVCISGRVCCSSQTGSDIEIRGFWMAISGRGKQQED